MDSKLAKAIQIVYTSDIYVARAQFCWWL